MSLLHTLEAAAELFLQARVLDHGKAAHHRLVLHLAAGQEGGEGGGKAEHAHALQDRGAELVAAQQRLDLLPPAVFPHGKSAQQGCGKQHHRSKRDPAEGIGPVDIAIARRSQAAGQCVVDVGKGRQHHDQHDREHRNDQHQHGRRVGHRVVQLFRDRFLVGIIAGKAEQHVLQPARALTGLDHLQGIVREDPAFLHGGGKSRPPVDLFLHDGKPLLQHAGLAAVFALQQGDGLVGLDAGLDHHRHALAKGAHAEFIQFFLTHDISPRSIPIEIRIVAAVADELVVGPVGGKGHVQSVPIVLVVLKADRDPSGFLGIEHVPGMV